MLLPDCYWSIGIGMLVAESMDLPFVYVRPKQKHRRQNQVGFLQKDKML
jgi:orotate phosphoribosyltransferase